MTSETPSRLLLDTHTFLWWDSDPGKLTARVLDLCLDSAVILVLSLVSLWEIQIKSSLGKLPFPLAEIVRDQQGKHGLQILPITLNHILTLDALLSIHKDPFDRLLIAQAQTENLPLASVDAAFTGYPVTLIW